MLCTEGGINEYRSTQEENENVHYNETQGCPPLRMSQKRTELSTHVSPLDVPAYLEPLFQQYSMQLCHSLPPRRGANRERLDGGGGVVCRYVFNCLIRDCRAVLISIPLSQPCSGSSATIPALFVSTRGLVVSRGAFALNIPALRDTVVRCVLTRA